MSEQKRVFWEDGLLNVLKDEHCNTRTEDLYSHAKHVTKETPVNKERDRKYTGSKMLSALCYHQYDNIIFTTVLADATKLIFVDDYSTKPCTNTCLACRLTGKSDPTSI